MKEIVTVNLENEMDLILAHKRAMKLCELSGLSLVVQTSLATAVSEIARCAIEHGSNAGLRLSVDTERGKKFIKAVVFDRTDFSTHCSEAANYARRLVEQIEFVKTPREFQLVLRQQVPFQGILTDTKIQTIIEYFASEPPLSAYDELRRKNILLQDMAEKIRESETDYRILTDSLPLMIFTINNRGVVTYTNKWLKDFLGNIPQEVTGSGWQSILHPGEYSVFIKEFNNAYTRQQPFNGQYRLRDNNTGAYVWHYLSLLPLRNDKQVVTRWSGFMVDIDAQKTVEQTLKDNRELHEAQQELFRNQNELSQKVIELNRSNHELEQFAHLATHDLQEPLRKLFFYSDVLKKRYAETIDPSGITVLNNMGNAAARMRELINDLLSYSRLQKQEVEFEQVSLNKILNDVIRDLDLQIKEKNASISVQELPSISGNTPRLRQLFANLVSNSLKYSRAGVPPVITVTSEHHDGQVHITVTDNGIGFEEKHAEKIFGLFERLHTRDEFPGTGIGLSICRKITELHHGKIWASSVPNQYTKFEITLPNTPAVKVK